jgi:hypothetical protein
VCAKIVPNHEYCGLQEAFIGLKTVTFLNIFPVKTGGYFILIDLKLDGANIITKNENPNVLKKKYDFFFLGGRYEKQFF